MQQLQVGKVKAFLADAIRARQAAQEQVDALGLAVDQAFQEIERLRSVDSIDIVPISMRRRQLLANITLQTKHHGLREERDAWVYAHNVVLVCELDDDDLESLHGYLGRLIEDMQNGCDWRHVPHAR